MKENWGCFRKADGTYHVIYVPFREETDGDLMSCWPTRPEAKKCAEEMTRMAELAALEDAGQLDLFKE